MPNHASAIKRNRQSIKRRNRNRTVRSEVRSTIRKARSLAADGKFDSAKLAVREAESLLSRAAARGLIHHRNASRKISRLASYVAKAAKGGSSKQA